MKKGVLLIFGLFILFGVVGFVSAVDCTDSDGGIYPNVTGSVIDNEGEVEDSCRTIYNVEQVVEYFCSEGKREWRAFDCEFGCEDGECRICEDSQQGTNYHVKGYITYNDGEKEDSCLSAGELTEYACNLGILKEYVVACPNGCEDGACVTSDLICEDSDGGVDYFVKGVVLNSDIEGRDYSGEDNCSLSAYSIESKFLIEYYCENNYMLHEMYECPENYGCKDGVCVEKVNNEAIPNPNAHPCIKAGYKCIRSTWTCGLDYELKDLSCGEGGLAQICCEDYSHCGDGICDPERTISAEDETSCPEDCSDDDTIIGDSSIDTDALISEDEEEYFCGGCKLDMKCYAFGYRLDDDFCSSEGIFVSQFPDDSQCSDNFECEDNICIDDKCVNQGFFSKFLNWFRKLFGID